MNLTTIRLKKNAADPFEMFLALRRVLKISIFFFLLNILLLPLATGAMPAACPTDATLKIYFLDVGNGESILIDYGTMEILIDGGFPDSSAAQYIKPYVDEPLDILVATHPHMDHIGGLIEVLDAFDVGQIWINGDAFPAKGRPGQIFNRFKQKIGAEGAPVFEARKGQTIKADGLSLDILHPATLIAHGSAVEVTRIMQIGNNNSIVLKLTYGKIACLFTGDAHVAAESEMLSTGLDLKADILKLGHHGSSASSSRQFLKAVNPKVAVYQANKDKRRRGPIKPSARTIHTLKNLGINVYGTDIHGTIVVTSDGEDFWIDTEK